jgi:hypothetical protein
VQGKPPRWTPLKDAERVNEDSGQYYRDPNAARYPQYPIAPVIQSVLDLNPDFSTADTDIVACGSTMGNLLRFARGQDKSFRFDVQTIGTSVFFIRKENDPRETIPNVRGYGHSFPEQNTTWDSDVKGSDTHQRIVQYDFRGFTCLIRFQCDGYINDEPTKAGAGASKTNPLADNDLLSAFGKTTVTRPTSQFPQMDGVKIDRGGAEVPQHTIFDLKTRSGRHKTEIDMADIYPQLWIKQIPNFIVAYHDGAGLFRDVRVQDVRQDVKDWEKDNMEAIQRLAVLLQEIVEFARGHGGLLEVYSPRKDCLEIRKQHGEGVHALPSELRDEWAKEAWVRDSEREVRDFSDSDEGGLALKDEYGSDKGWGYHSDGEEPDYTACSADDCGYCGKCTY